LPHTWSCGVALEGRLGEPYDEEAFGCFLSIERKRCERSDRTFFLILVELTEEPGVSTRIDPRVASKLFLGLHSCLRETDFIGWYREGRIAGAVLTESPNRPRTDVSLGVGQRVSEALAACLPSHLARRLRVRVHQHPESGRIESTRIGQLQPSRFPMTLGDI
jgi:hypothetical protein